jgi:hypothetical protein
LPRRANRRCDPSKRRIRAEATSDVVHIAFDDESNEIKKG